MKTSEEARRAAVSIDPNRHYQGLFLQDIALHWQEKKFIFLTSLLLERCWFIRWQVSNLLRPDRIYSACKVSLWNCDHDASRRQCA